MKHFSIPLIFISLLLPVPLLAATYCGTMSYCNNMKFIVKNETTDTPVFIVSYKKGVGSLVMEPNYSSGCKEPWASDWEPNNDKLDPGESITVYGHESSSDISGELFLTIARTASKDKHATANVSFTAQAITTCSNGLTAPSSSISSDEHFTIKLDHHNAKGTDAYVKVTIQDQ